MNIIHLFKRWVSRELLEKQFHYSQFKIQKSFSFEKGIEAEARILRNIWCFKSIKARVIWKHNDWRKKPETIVKWICLNYLFLTYILSFQYLVVISPNFWGYFLAKSGTRTIKGISRLLWNFGKFDEQKSVENWWERKVMFENFQYKQTCSMIFI